MRTSSRAGKSARSATTFLAGSRSRFPARGEAASDDDELGIEHVHERSDAVPEDEADPLQQVAGVPGTHGGEIHRQASVNGLPCRLGAA